MEVGIPCRKKKCGYLSLVISSQPQQASDICTMLLHVIGELTLFKLITMEIDRKARKRT